MVAPACCAKPPALASRLEDDPFLLGPGNFSGAFVMFFYKLPSWWY